MSDMSILRGYHRLQQIAGLLALTLLLGGCSQPAALADPFLPTGAGSQAVGSAAILQQCWSETELSGPTQGIQKPLPVDLDGPSPDAIQRAAMALPPLPSYLRGSIRSVDLAQSNSRPAGQKWVALTFDLCEQANERTGYQADTINYLRQHRIPATFYAGGKWMKTHPQQAMQLMADPLFEVGNHAWSHGNMRVLTGAAMRRQITWTQAQYAQLRDELAARSCTRAAGSNEMARIPRYPTTFRFPYGTCSQESLDALADYGLAAIQWTVVTGDPARGQSAAGIARQVLNGVKSSSGSIVIAHANGRGWNTAAALPQFIPQLQADGYRFVTVSDLLLAGQPVSAQSCYELRPGDNARYDRLFGEGTGE
ncbi:polysaccharide deacetylase family protein [Thiorhodovibrio frisius]|uniref:Putative xylanase/chitin deacetylase n=1 Tax=Thiorhodovibrio frisius TaxID=631362 RepID=H8Z8D5_9GAMM|nr:polysaccharide deacetylase family protein [Thiorhodovibrio frisius]EIC19340.1 putative xylanase/chitin deacetylase [Thiorhodovibrio frisius]WPL22361.1 putative polysaccharide deacetylase PdaA precursor [Thiorhodovibrio frisius]